MKTAIKKYLPLPALEFLYWIYSIFTRIFDYFSDYFRYSKHAMRSEHAVFQLSHTQLEAQITRDYHRIEKGLALKSPKRPFGAKIIHRLDTLLPLAQERMPNSEFVRAAYSAREALIAWNSGGNVNDTISPPGSANRPEIDIFSFITSRHSVRDFDPKQVDENLLQKAIKLAGLSPSVCNRQPWHARVYHGDQAHKILRYQSGNQGFGTGVPAVILITVELGHFAGSHERNQAWIEGGIFSTTLMWALHGLGLSTCMLNLSLKTSETNTLRSAASIPSSEVPIMMLATGYSRSGYRVARSPRRETSQIIVTSHIAS